MSRVTLVFLLATAGCADVNHLLPKMRAAFASSHTTALQAAAVQPVVQTPSASQPRPLPSGAVDMSGVLQGAVRLPADVQHLREAIVTGLIIISVLGITNIALMFAVLGRLRRMAHVSDDFTLRAPVMTYAPAPARAPEPAVAPMRAAPVSATAVLPARSCACGAEISPRSRTGRCRACARTATIRAKRAARSTEIPVHA
ncbi:MAG: hypothetical protein GIW94_04145 [Candidatus Eremiobacteraeota bacterium]|nr:hypothetical protein [Candidatus Eremiobacteraeota bacterium]